MLAPSACRTIRSLSSVGTGAAAYADAVATYFALVVSRLADRCSNLCSWDIRDGQGRKRRHSKCFLAASIPMTWDFAEANPLSELSGELGQQYWADLTMSLQSNATGGTRQYSPNRRRKEFVSDPSRSLFPLTRPITIISATLTYRTSFTSGFADRFSGIWPDLFRRLTTPKDRRTRRVLLIRHGGAVDARPDVLSSCRA